ncbi:FAD-dependent oxidoreductase domain-containing protein 2 [Desmodus rotundus]|uniref:FAD-dependent oxidoreductase domain-containing protein 2 n=1 Tax=Desmodus rotundus TaxID=9430 RepID=UPI0023812F79|nr:FAD-dependent oxidoreductase domain-containing protein 2 [Desmodus rotundus]XP_053775486.1 FAD-dependent oxidoreductase domain-containing protein 2 [Desmodus rotundus]XP_053775487.1 FAD-dependent oxidoreductase domain-containing protein 2 [Desmodus rotundus]
MGLSILAPVWGPSGLLLTIALYPALTLYLAKALAPPHRDYCVLGAGPAGLQMAYFLQQAGRDYTVFERAAEPGSFFTRYPRHRKLISINKRYTGRANSEFNLRHDWNSLLSHDPRLLFRHYSHAYFPDASDMVRYLGDFAARLGLRVLYNTTIAHVTLEKDRQAWNGHYFILTDQRGQTYQCSVLLVATGLSVPNLVDFPGSEYAEGYESVSVDPKDFVGQNVLILGRGNSAFETSENILGVTNFIHMLSRSRVRLSWATHYVGDLRAVNNGLLDTYQLKSLDGLLESDLADLAVVKDREGKFHITLRFYVEESNQSAEAIALPQDDSDNFAMRVAYDRVIRCLGWNFNFSIFNESLRLSSGGEFSKKYPLIRASYESKGSRGLFVLGTASHSVDYRKSAGGFIHGFRYTVRAVHRLLERRHHGAAWPSTEHPITQLTSSILRRVNEASGLYQMFSVLADVVLLKENATAFEYLEEFPMQMVAQLEAITGRKARHGLFVVNMEYGRNFSGPDKDVFFYERSVGHTEDAWRSNFLHPVIYYYRHLPTEQEVRFRPADWPLPRPTAIHHIVEDFLTDWTAPVNHILPLRRFLENCLDTDLRSFYAESCFLFTLTRQKLPPFCQQGYLRTQGLVGTRSLRQHRVDSGLLQAYATAGRRTEDSGQWPGYRGPGDQPQAPGPLVQPLNSDKEEL